MLEEVADLVGFFRVEARAGLGFRSWPGRSSC
jgi:hypothetical protein